jgi:hypothetical protein
MAAGPGAAPLLVVFGQAGEVGTWTWRPDAAGGDWLPAPPGAAPPWRDAAAMAADPASGGVILFGGVRAAGGRPAADTWAWDGAGWRELAPAHRPAGGPAAMAAAPGGPLLFERDGTWQWRGSDWAPLAGPGTPAWQPYGAMASLPGGALLVTGGLGGGSRTWSWDGSRWISR